MQCRECGYEIPSGKRFCRKCGTAALEEANATQLGSEIQASQRGMIACSGCGKDIELGKRFCRYCGAPCLGGTAQAAHPAEAEPCTTSPLSAAPQDATSVAALRWTSPELSSSSIATAETLLHTEAAILPGAIPAAETVKESGAIAFDGGNEHSGVIEPAIPEVEEEPKARWDSSASQERSPSFPSEELAGVSLSESSSGFKYSADDESDSQPPSGRNTRRGLFVLLATVLVVGALGLVWLAVSRHSLKPTTTASQPPPPGTAAVLPPLPTAPSPAPAAPSTSAEQTGSSSQPPNNSGDSQATGGKQKAASSKQLQPQDAVKPLRSPVAAFTGDQQVSFGESLKLHWRVTDATSVRIDPGALNVDPHGGDLTIPSVQTAGIYKLTATGPGGSDTLTWQVTVNPKIANFEAVPFSIEKCDVALLRWAVKGSSSILIDNNVGNVTSAPYKLVRPMQTTSYTLTALGGGGKATAAIVVPAFPANPACSQR
jgi:hypothetical protein